MATLICKTSSRTLANVIKYQKHALRGRPSNLVPGDTILVSENRDGLRYGQKQIRYSMIFVQPRRDSTRESQHIWGRYWPWIIECTDRAELANPFNISDVQVTTKEYGRGGTLVYLDTRDEQFLIKAGYFKTL